MIAWPDSLNKIYFVCRPEYKIKFATNFPSSRHSMRSPGSGDQSAYSLVTFFKDIMCSSLRSRRDFCHKSPVFVIVYIRYSTNRKSIYVESSHPKFINRKHDNFFFIDVKRNIHTICAAGRRLFIVKRVSTS